MHPTESTDGDVRGGTRTRSGALGQGNGWARRSSAQGGNHRAEFPPPAGISAETAHLTDTFLGPLPQPLLQTGEFLDWPQWTMSGTILEPATPTPKSSRSERMSRPISRILFPGVLRHTRSAAIHLGLPSPAGSSGLPADLGRTTLERLRRHRCWTTASSWPCSGWGLPSHPGHPRCWWSLTPPFHPYPAQPAGRSVFCGTVPRVSPGCR
jgi:hypothetical protein